MSLLGNVTRQGGKIMAIASKHDVLVALNAPNPKSRVVCGLIDLDKGILAFWFADGTAQRWRLQPNPLYTIEDYHSFQITNAGRRYKIGKYNLSILALLNNHTPIGVDL